MEGGGPCGPPFFRSGGRSRDVGTSPTPDRGAPAGPPGYQMAPSTAVTIPPAPSPHRWSPCSGRTTGRIVRAAASPFARRTALVALPAFLALATAPVDRANAQAPSQAPVPAHPTAAASTALPFAIGEALNYQVRIARLGDVGTGRMWIEGPLVEHGVTVWRLRSEINAGKGPIRATDRTSSWVDPVRMAIVRFTKEEHHVLSNSEEDVTIDGAAGRWRDADGPSGRLGSDAPLDELSFLYFLRTLPLGRDTVLRFDRHFDAARNPTIVRIKGEETLTTPAGIFRTRVVEMEVRDPKRYKGTGTIRINLYAEECHIPIRIESRMPVLGITTLTLTGWSHSPRYPDALPCD